MSIFRYFSQNRINNNHNDACFVNDTPCAFEPKYNMISDAIEESDVIVLIFPVYWYAVPAQQIGRAHV